jgi:hypothetical protein
MRIEVSVPSSANPARPRVSRRRCSRSLAGAFEGGLHDVANGEAGGVLGDLADVADAGAAADGDFTGVGLDFAGEDGEEGGLAGTVGADEADPVAFIYGKRDFFEEGCRAETLGHALCVENWWHHTQFTG